MKPYYKFCYYHIQSRKNVQKLISANATLYAVRSSHIQFYKKSFKNTSINLPAIFTPRPCLRPFALPLFFAVMPLAKLHQLLIFALSFPVYCSLSWFISNYVSHLFISGISFLIHAFFMPVHFFLERNQGVKQGLGVPISKYPSKSHSPDSFITKYLK